MVGGGRWEWCSPGEILAPVFIGAGDGDARGCRDLFWKRRRGGVLLLPTALAPEGNLRFAGSGDGGVFASFSSLGASSRSRLRLGDWWIAASSSWMAASSPCSLLRRGAGFCLATMMSSRGARVAAWTSVVGSSRRVRGALPWLLGCFEVEAALERVQVVTMTDTRRSFAEGTVGASPAYFPCVARHQSRSCRLLASVAICWHVPSWILFHVGGQVGRWCPCHVGCVVSVLAWFSIN